MSEKKNFLLKALQCNIKRLPALVVPPAPNPNPPVVLAPPKENPDAVLVVEGVPKVRLPAFVVVNLIKIELKKKRKKHEIYVNTLKEDSDLNCLHLPDVPIFSNCPD